MIEFWKHTFAYVIYNFWMLFEGKIARSRTKSNLGCWWVLKGDSEAEKPQLGFV